MRVFAIIFACLLVASAVAIAIRPKPAAKGITPLVWVSDDNPARREQIALFNKLNPIWKFGWIRTMAGWRR